jgi:hypothetical protein
MVDFRIHKVVSSLPSQLEANTLYLARTGEGFDLYCSDATGAIAYTQNGTLNNITFSDSTEIDFTITGQDITALLKSESISKSKLGTDVKTSLDLADNAVQPADIGVTVQSYNADTVIDANYVATEENFTNTLKIKLDGIEAGATADQTASEILTAIKTVDGSGSGLDADTLDGQQGSYYQPASTALTTTTSFSGDVSGTYNAIVIADDSHTHDTRYFTETEADARFLGINAKAADSTLLDGVAASDYALKTDLTSLESIILYLSPLDKDISATTKAAIIPYFPYNLEVSELVLEVDTAPTGSNIQVDINVDGVSFLTTVISIDATELSSTTATTIYAINTATFTDSRIPKGSSITVDIDQIGSTVPGQNLVLIINGERY